MKVDDEFEYQREYPLGSLFGHDQRVPVVHLGNTGVENVYNDVLIGRDTRLQIGSLRNISDLFSASRRSATSCSRLRPTRSRPPGTRSATGSGSIVALDPRTGAILAMYSNPSFDPQPLAGRTTPSEVNAYCSLR